MASPWRDIYPLLSVNSPQEIWENQPTFLIAEILFWVLLVLCLREGVKRKEYMLAISASLCGGAAIELMTILNHNIGNFYHSQAMLMSFGYREPLYMLIAFYIWFQFIPLAMPWKMNLGRWGESAASALFITIILNINDLVGAKYIWWLWHAHDPLFKDRDAGGVPEASAFWIMASQFALAYILRYLRDAMDMEKQSLFKVITIGAISGPLATGVFMNIPFMLIFHPMVSYKGYEAGLALLVFRIICGLIVIASILSSWKKVSFGFQPNWGLFCQTIFVFLPTIIGIVCLYTPYDSVRTSYGQVFGDCETMEPSLWGAFTRRKNVCLADVDPIRDHYRFDCLSEDQMPKDGHDWYTVCGTTLPEGWRDTVLTMCGALVLFTIFTQSVRIDRSTTAKKQKKKN